MRIDFNALWVDDQPERVTSLIEKITRDMNAEGFEFKPLQCTTIDKVKDIISDDVFTDEVDLILVDWDLGNDTYGEDAINSIRQIVRYKDIVFYSGQKQVVELQEKVHKNKLEGIYCTSREGLVDEVIGVFESLIKKVLDLDHTRGIVMGATCDIDHIVNSCLHIAHDSLDENGQSKFIQEARERVAKKLKKLVKLGKKIEEKPSMKALFKAHMLFTSDDRLQLLASILSMPAFAVHSDYIAMVNSYRQGVVQGRNQLGHAVLVPQGKPSTVVNSIGKNVDIGEMRELRKLILSLRTDFRTLLDAMRG